MIHHASHEGRAFAALLLFMACIHTHAQFMQQGPKLLSAAAIGAANQGSAVALSFDASTAVVGAAMDNGGAGAAFVYARVGSGWSPGVKLVAPNAVGNAQQGWSVAISQDGNTILVGGAIDNDHTGAAWVYVRDVTGAWGAPEKLVGSGATGAALQGWSVALSADGRTAIVGGPFHGTTLAAGDLAPDPSQVGAAWIWTRDAAGQWTEEKVTPPASEVSGGAHFGVSVSLSADGQTALVGAPYDNDNHGAAWIFERGGGGWAPSPKLAQGAGELWQGQSVALSGDGGTAVIGAPYDPLNGATWVYLRAASWLSPQRIVGSPSVGPGVQDSQGSAVSVSDDGRLIMAGAPVRSDLPAAGQVCMFALGSSGTWTQLGPPLVGSGAIGLAEQGWSVALSADGQTAMVGGLRDNAATGAAWVYAQATLCPSVFFESVGDLPGDCYASMPSDISGNGAYVSLSSSSDEPYTPNDGGACPRVLAPHSNEAAGWTRPCRHVEFFSPPLPGAGGLKALGYLSNSNAGHEESLANGISHDGEVVVGFSNYAASNHTKAVVFLPTRTRVLRLGADSSAAARDISQRGAPPDLFGGSAAVRAAMNRRIVVGYSTPAHQGPQRALGASAVYWDAWNHIVQLPTTPPGGLLPNGKPVASSEALCISDDGTMIGGRLYYDQLANPQHYMSYPCVWRQDPSLPTSGNMYDLIVLSDLPGGDDNARVTHLSGDGTVLVGYGAEGTADPACWDDPRTACKWVFDPVAGTWSLPIPLAAYPGAMFTAAHGVNRDGSVIVGTCLNISDPCTDPWFEDQAVIWKNGGTAAPPQVIATILGSHVPPGWMLFEALRVSANGRTITGYGFDPDYNQIGWVAGVP